MAHHVFLSHSSIDKSVADKLCASLEKAGVQCWMAPRDIQAGQTWGASIVNAIENSLIMVVVFSENSNASKQVMREVERAVQKDIVVVPFRIDDTSPSRDMEYFLSATHWLDAQSQDLSSHMDDLIKIIISIIDDAPLPDKLNPATTSSPTSISPEQQTTGSTTTKARLPWAMIIGGIVLIALTLSAGWFMRGNTLEQQPSAQLANVAQQPIEDNEPVETFDQTTTIQTSSETDSENKTDPEADPNPTPEIESESVLEPEPETEPETIVIVDESLLQQQKANQLLVQCDAHLAANRLISAVGGNALDCYKEVLRIVPDNLIALEGLTKIEQTFADLTDSAISSKSVDSAQSNLEKLRTLNPNHLSLQGLDSRLKNLQDDIATQAQLAKKKAENRKLDDNAWSKVSCDDTTKINNYLKIFPNGRHIQEANNCLNAIEIAAQAKLEAKRKAEAEIQKQIKQEQSTWNSVDCTSEVEVIGYLDTYPDGKFETEAKHCLNTIAKARQAEEEQISNDKALWAATDCKDDSDLNIYLNSFPQGIYAGSAKSCLEEIAQQQKVVFGIWKGKLSGFELEINLSKSGSTLTQPWANGNNCFGELTSKTPIENLTLGKTIEFTYKRKVSISGCVKKIKMKLTWQSANQVKVELFKFGISTGSGLFNRG